MWDACFMLMFGKYAKNVFDFQNTLDNFYAKQHSDRFISQQLIELTGKETFEKNDLTSTGPNILEWFEWEYYLNFGDKDRLSRVFPCLLAYHEWTRLYRSWPDGSYFSCGWACGMDNQPRIEELNTESDQDFHHGFTSWIDSTIQAVINGKCLIKMAKILGRAKDVVEVIYEVNYLTQYINTKMWDKKPLIFMIDTGMEN